MSLSSACIRSSIYTCRHVLTQSCLCKHTQHKTIHILIHAHTIHIHYYKCVCTHTHTHMHAHAHKAHTCAQSFTHTCTCTHNHVCATTHSTQIYTFIHAHTMHIHYYKCTHTHMHAHTHACMHSHTHALMYACTHTTNTHTHLHLLGIDLLDGGRRADGFRGSKSQGSMRTLCCRGDCGGLSPIGSLIRNLAHKHNNTYMVKVGVAIQIQGQDRCTD